MRFRGGVQAVSPLQLQLRVTTSEGSARITSIQASGDNASGSCSRPALSRPGTIGTASSIITPETLEPQGGDSFSELGSAFSGAPSIPAVSVHSSNLPIYFQWASPVGFIVPPMGAALLYAVANSGHTWSASLEWEEP